MYYIEKELKRVKTIKIILTIIRVICYIVFYYILSMYFDDMVGVMMMAMFPSLIVHSILASISPNDFSRSKFIKHFKIENKDFICLFNKYNNTFYVYDKLSSCNIQEKLDKFKINEFVDECIENKMDNDLITEEFISNEINKRAGKTIAKFQVTYLQETVKKEKIKDLVNKL